MKILLVAFMLLSFAATAQSNDSKDKAKPCPNAWKDNSGNWKCDDQDPLPVTFISFEGKAARYQVNLEWRFENPYNHSHFEIERSYDGLNFLIIGSTISSVYSDDTAQGNSYYLLCSVDLDGTRHRYKVIYVHFIPDLRVYKVQDLFGRLVGIYDRFERIPAGLHLINGKKTYIIK